MFVKYEYLLVKSVVIRIAQHMKSLKAYS